MPVIWYETDDLNPVTLEGDLNLPPGSIKAVTITPSGAVAVEYKAPPDAVVIDKTKTALNKYNLPKGHRARNPL